jgi:copper chaperone CopZ
MTNKQEESKNLWNTFPISTRTTATTTTTAAVAGGGNHGISPPSLLIPESKLMTIQAQFGLEGLTCSSCSNSVLEAVRHLANELLSEENIVMDPNSIRVALFPDAKLDVIVSCSPEKMNGVMAKIVDCIEDIGFEAELRSKKEIRNSDNDEEQMNEEEIEMRTVLIKVEQNAKLLFEFYNTILVESNDIEHLQWHRSDKMVDNEGYDTFELSYRPSVTGIRDIIDRGKYSKEIQEHGGCGKMEVTDANSYHLMMEKTEQRRRQEILNWRNGEFSVIFRHIFKYVVGAVCNSFIPPKY